MAAKAYQFLDEELDHAIGYDEDAMHIQAQDTAHAAGVSQIQREEELNGLRKQNEQIGKEKPSASA
jgi:hypothetical protein